MNNSRLWREILEMQKYPTTRNIFWVKFCHFSVLEFSQNHHNFVYLSFLVRLQKALASFRRRAFIDFPGFPKKPASYSLIKSGRWSFIKFLRHSAFACFLDLKRALHLAFAFLRPRKGACFQVRSSHRFRNLFRARFRFRFRHLFLLDKEPKPSQPALDGCSCGTVIGDAAVEDGAAPAVWAATGGMVRFPGNLLALFWQNWFNLTSVEKTCRNWLSSSMDLKLSKETHFR